MSRPGIFAAAAVLALIAGTALAGPSAPASVLAGQLQPRMAIGDLRQLNQLSGPDALPAWYELLARANEGAFRQFTGGVRGVLTEKILTADPEAALPAERIERASNLAVDEPERAAAFQSLAAVGSPRSLQVLMRYLYDPRAPGGDPAPPNSTLAAKALASVYRLRLDNGAPLETFGPAEVTAIQEWSEASIPVTAGG